MKLTAKQIQEIKDRRAKGESANSLAREFNVSRYVIYSQVDDKYKAYQKAYQKTDKYKAYRKTDKHKAYQKAYQKAYYLRKKSKKPYDSKRHRPLSVEA